jgi:hypothetical protein
VGEWLARHGIEARGPVDWQGSRKWVLPVCPWNPEHTNRSAYVVQFPSGAIAAGCHHNGCAGKGWPELRDLFEPGYRERQQSYAGSATNGNGHAHGEKIHPSASKSEAADGRILPFRTARQVAEETPADIEWIAKPWVVAGAITEVVGKIKQGGKTTWVTHLCRAVLDGRLFMGEPTTRTGVVYLTEQAPRSFREALRRASLLDRDDFALLFWHDTVGVKWPDVVRAAVLEAKRRDAGLLVIDTLGQFAGIRGDNENSSGAALEAVEPLQEAAATGLAAVIIRHERKSGGDVGDSGRGSSAFAGAVDVVLSLRRPEGNPRPTLRAIHSLSRFDETPDTLVIELTPDGYTALGTQEALAAQDAERALLDAMPTSEAAAKRVDELAEGLPSTKRTVAYEAVAALFGRGNVRRVGEGKRGKPYRYWRPLRGDTGDEIHPSAASPYIRTDESNQGDEWEEIRL